MWYVEAAPGTWYMKSSRLHRVWWEDTTPRLQDGYIWYEDGQYARHWAASLLLPLLEPFDLVRANDPGGKSASFAKSSRAVRIPRAWANMATEEDDDDDEDDDEDED